MLGLLFEFIIRACIYLGRKQGNFYFRLKKQIHIFISIWVNRKVLSNSFNLSSSITFLSLVFMLSILLFRSLLYSFTYKRILIFPLILHFFLRIIYGDSYSNKFKQKHFFTLGFDPNKKFSIRWLLASSSNQNA